MRLSDGGAPPQSGNPEGGPELARLLEAAQWLLTAGIAPERASAQPVPQLQALVVHLGPRSLLEAESLRGFSDRFPGIAILVHGRGTNDVERHTLPRVIAAFSSSRRLSPRQRLVLEFHLNGQNDKEIASSLGVAGHSLRTLAADGAQVPKHRQGRLGCRLSPLSRL